MFKVPTSPVADKTSATTRETPTISTDEVMKIRACFAPIQASSMSGEFSRSLPSRSGDSSMFGSVSRLGYEKPGLKVDSAPNRSHSR